MKDDMEMRPSVIQKSRRFKLQGQDGYLLITQIYSNTVMK